MRRFLIGLMLLSLVSTACAETRVLSLDQALAVAMEKNRDIEKAGAYARYVQGKYMEERAAALPQLGLAAGYKVSRDDGQPAAFGGKLTMASSYATLSVSQPLYTWGKIGAAIRAAEEGLKTADDELRLARQTAWREVSTAFYDILLQRELGRLATENLEQRKRHAEEAHKRFSAGVATDYDVLAADVAVENARPEEIRTANQLRIARERLRFLLAMEEVEIDVRGNLATAPEPPPLYDSAFKMALEKRPELAEQRHRIGIYEELVTIAGADDKPRLDLKGGAGYGTLDSTLFDSAGPNWNAGVYLSFPFFDGFRTSGRVQQARSDLATRRIEEKKLLDAISLEVRTAINNLRESAGILAALDGTVRQAERLLQMAEKGYEFGVKMRLEVDDAQLNLLQAKSGFARASRDYLVARANLATAMGVAGE